MDRVAFFVSLDRLVLDVQRRGILLPAEAWRLFCDKLERIEPCQRGKWKLVFDIHRKMKPRTSGPKSQQAHLHGHLSTIAESLGYYMSEIKEAMKADLTSWPRRIVMGQTIYMSEADADTVLEAKAIEWCHVKAAEFGIRLIEDGEEE